MKLKVLSYNTLFAGRDGTDQHRYLAQIELINELQPDIFLMQEAKGFDANGSALLYAMENSIGMRGFLALAPRTGQHLAIFIREPLRALNFDPDSMNFHHALANLKVMLPESRQVLSLFSAHLCPNGAVVRRQEAAYLSVLAEPEQLCLLAGDFNSASPHDPEPGGFDNLAPQHRARYLADDLRNVDCSVLAGLEAAGWVDLGHALDPQCVPTVPTKAYNESAFAVMRCDYMLASQALASAVRSYSVIVNAVTNVASDHYPILTTFELPSLAR